jgi:hypothetical protein
VFSQKTVHVDTRTQIKGEDENVNQEIVKELLSLKEDIVEACDNDNHDYDRCPCHNCASVLRAIDRRIEVLHTGS